MTIFPLIDYLVDDRIMTLPEGLTQVYFNKYTCHAVLPGWGDMVINYCAHMPWHLDLHRGQNVWVPDWFVAFKEDGGFLWAMDAEEDEYAHRNVAIGKL